MKNDLKRVDRLINSLQKLRKELDETPEAIDVVGNNGGDYLVVQVVRRDNEDDVLHVKMGSSCVTYFDIMIPVTIITSLLAFHFSPINEITIEEITKLFESHIDYPKEYKTKLIDMFANLNKNTINWELDKRGYIKT